MCWRQNKKDHVNIRIHMNDIKIGCIVIEHYLVLTVANIVVYDGTCDIIKTNIV